MGAYSSAQVADCHLACRNPYESGGPSSCTLVLEVRGCHDAHLDPLETSAKDRVLLLRQSMAVVKHNRAERAGSFDRTAARRAGSDMVVGILEVPHHRVETHSLGDSCRRAEEGWRDAGLADRPGARLPSSLREAVHHMLEKGSRAVHNSLSRGRTVRNRGDSGCDDIRRRRALLCRAHPLRDRRDVDTEPAALRWVAAAAVVVVRMDSCSSWSGTSRWPVVHTVVFGGCDGLSQRSHEGRRREDCNGVWGSDARPGARAKERNRV